MTSREAFEQAMNGRKTGDAWVIWQKAWQAAEKQALERAIDACAHISGYAPREYYVKTIRALMDQDASIEKEMGNADQA